jgi:hypothetical protein
VLLNTSAHGNSDDGDHGGGGVANNEDDNGGAGVAQPLTNSHPDADPADTPLEHTGWVQSSPQHQGSALAMDYPQKPPPGYHPMVTILINDRGLTQNEAIKQANVLFELTPVNDPPPQPQQQQQNADLGAAPAAANVESEPATKQQQQQNADQGAKPAAASGEHEQPAAKQQQQQNTDQGVKPAAASIEASHQVDVGTAIPLMIGKSGANIKRLRKETERRSTSRRIRL